MFDETALKEIIETGPEVASYLVIEELGGFIWTMNHDMSHDRIPEKDIPAIERDVAHAVEEILMVTKGLTRFGLIQPLTEGNLGTPEYWKWYRWWNDYVGNLSDEDFYKLGNAILKNENVSDWRPQGSWKE